MRRASFQAGLLLLLGATMFAQARVQQFRADVTDAVGRASGQVVLTSDQLVFVSDSKPEASFAAPRHDIQDINVDGNLIAIQLRNPIRDASGERNRITLRAADESAAAAVSSWFNRGSSATSVTSGDAPRRDDSSAAIRSYQAHHKKRFGGSRGRLLVTNTGLAYESIDNVGDSRRWEYQDIKELKLRNPYELEIEPFNGDKYTLELEGQGMSNGEYQELIDRITKARVAPRK
ncbi:MAG: hypothetical protein JWO19_2026 [Bryobacterales bacterium]|nr:hypothetical protein [Bryobacterales bacterium]